MAEVAAGPTTADLQSMNHNYYIALISITILVYDFILTFPAEVERFWFTRRVNFAMCLFYLNRYLVPFAYVPILIENFWVNDEPTKLKICRDLQAYHEYFTALLQIIIAAMLIMRIYALYNRDVRVLVCLVVISVLLFAIGCWAGFGYGPKLDVNDDVLVKVGCGISTSFDRAKRLTSTWALLFLFDVIIFGMTLYKTSTFPRSNNANTLITVFTRDGAIYFGIVAACNVMNILFLLFGEPLLRASGVTLSNALSSVVMTRLTLNLRDPSFIISASERRRLGGNASEHPDLTIVESNYPTEFSDRVGGRFLAESEYEDGEEASDVYHHPSRSRSRLEGDDIELHRTGVV